MILVSKSNGVEVAIIIAFISSVFKDLVQQNQTVYY